MRVASDFTEQILASELLPNITWRSERQKQESWEQERQEREGASGAAPGCREGGNGFNGAASAGSGSNAATAGEKAGEYIGETAGTHSLSRGRPQRESAVLMLISEDPDPAVLFTRRARGIRQAGQVSFPGGGREAGENPDQTAVRETREEIGLLPAQIEIIGRLPAQNFTRQNAEVIPVVGRWQGDLAQLRLSEAEVCEAFAVPVAELAAPENRVTWELAGRLRGPAFAVPRVLTNRGQQKPQFIWGLTGTITDAVLRIFGWEQPWDTSHRVPVPSEFR